MYLQWIFVGFCHWCSWVLLPWWKCKTSAGTAACICVRASIITWHQRLFRRSCCCGKRLSFITTATGRKEALITKPEFWIFHWQTMEKMFAFNKTTTRDSEFEFTSGPVWIHAIHSIRTRILHVHVAGFSHGCKLPTMIIYGTYTIIKFSKNDHNFTTKTRSDLFSPFVYYLTCEKTYKCNDELLWESDC